MKRKSEKKKLLWLVIFGFCVTVLIFLLSWQISTPDPTRSASNTINHNTCSPSQIKDVDVPVVQMVHFSGSTTFASLNDPNPKDQDSIFTAIRKAHPQFHLQYIDPAKESEAPGSTVGIKWLIQGTQNLRFALSSRPINPEEYQAAKDKPIREEPVAYDIIALYVGQENYNKNNLGKGLKGLTLADIQRIFTENIEDWAQIRKGPNVKIAPFARKPEDSGTAQFFQKNVLNGQNFRSDIHPIGQKGDPKEQTTTLAIRDVANDPGGISFATTSELINQKSIRIVPIAKNNTPKNFVSPCTDTDCKAVDTSLIAKESYPEELTRKLYVIIKKDGGTDQKAGEAYVKMLKSCEGQELLKQAGFVPAE